jgi:hypothetical protein
VQKAAWAHALCCPNDPASSIFAMRRCMVQNEEMTQKEAWCMVQNEKMMVHGAWCKMRK